MGKKRAVKLRPGEFELDGVKYDAWYVQLAADPLVAKHKLQIDKQTKCYVITIDFLKDLTASISKLGRAVSPQQALDAWTRAVEVVDEYQKKTRSTRS